jgi:hypothetical protein
MLQRLAEVRGEAVEVVLPEASIGVKPRRGIAHRTREQTDSADAAVAPSFNEFGPLQHDEMLADGRKRHWERPSQFANGCLPNRETTNDGPTSGIR